MNIGEEICGEYLRHIRHCDFVQYNVMNLDNQGEMDVMGINLEQGKIYICEVATHTRGLGCSRKEVDEHGKMRVVPDDYNRFKRKFEKNIEYAEKYFKQYENKVLMIWAPIVNKPKSESAYSAYDELQRLKSDLMREHKLHLELAVNEEYYSKLMELKEKAGTINQEAQSSVMRVFQIEEKLKRKIGIK